MILYLVSTTVPDIYFAVHYCAWFIHNTKASHETYLKRICQFLQGNKYNGLLFNPYKKLVVDFYDDAYFAGLWGRKNPQDPICDRSRTRLLVIFFNCPLFWVSKLCIHIDLYNFYHEYVELSHSVIALLPLKCLIKDMIDNLLIDSYKLKFVWSATV